MINFPLVLSPGSSEYLPDVLNLSDLSSESTYGCTISGSLTLTYTYYTNNGKISGFSVMNFQ